MRAGEQMEIINQKIEAIEAQIKTLKDQLSVLKDVRSAMTGEQPQRRTGGPRANVKGVVLELLEQVGQKGLNAAVALTMAKDLKGIDLDRGSVSSLLSRLKSDGVVWHDGSVYRLAKYSGGGAGSVFPLPPRTSDGTQF